MNLSIATGPQFEARVFTTAKFEGIATQTFEIPGIPAGTYLFSCTIHPGDHDRRDHARVITEAAPAGSRDPAQATA
jgi:hypothetical protein